MLALTAPDVQRKPKARKYRHKRSHMHKDMHKLRQQQESPTETSRGADAPVVGANAHEDVGVRGHGGMGADGYFVGAEAVNAAFCSTVDEGGTWGILDRENDWWARGLGHDCLGMTDMQIGHVDSTL